MVNKADFKQELDSPWGADWIRILWGDRSPLLRKEFTVKGDFKAAFLQCTALGVCEPRLNGQKVGEYELTPGWTDYRKRVHYYTFDVTKDIVTGENVLGAILGNGWFAGYYGPFQDKGFYGKDSWFSARLFVYNQDGTCTTIETDSTWKGAEGPHLSSDLLMGEEYDARKEISGWDTTSPADVHWHEAMVLDPAFETTPEIIEEAPSAGIITKTVLSAKTVNQIGEGTYIYDLGQNIVGTVGLTLDLPEGHKITLRHAEVLNKDGTPYIENLRFAKATDTYTASGNGEVFWKPTFTFHGFRYIEISGLPEALPLDKVSGHVIMSGMTETLSFSSSNEKLNRLFENIKWGFRGNYVSVPTDCPQRDERLGWTGDVQMFMKSASYLADIQDFHKKWLVDLADAQFENGAYPDVAPSMGRLGNNCAAWGDAGVICPYVIWQFFGATDRAAEHWDGMNRYMDSILAEGNKHNSEKALTYGDWLNFDKEGTSHQLLGLAYRAWNCRLMKEMAEALGKSEEVSKYAAEYENSRVLFANQFLAEKEKLTQTACALGIYMDLLDGEVYQLAADTLVQLLADNNNYLTTGFVGTGYLCPALSKIGRSDLAMQIVVNEDCPSWFYEINNGATTIWERWNSYTEEDGFGDVGMNSFNHYAFGAVLEWMIGYLGGILPATAGFETVSIKPFLKSGLTTLDISYQSVKGPISVKWNIEGTTAKVELTTPVSAEVQLTPDAEVQHLSEGTHHFEVSIA